MEGQKSFVPVAREIALKKSVSECMKSSGIGVASSGKVVGGLAVKKIIAGLAVAVALGGGGYALISNLGNGNGSVGFVDSQNKNEADDPKLNIDDEDIIKSGTSGDVSWVYTEDKELIIYGEGAMCDYVPLEEGDVHNENLPENKSSWHKYDIEKIIIKEGVTHVGANAFDCFGVFYTTEVEIMMADSVTSIGEAAFCNMRYVKSLELSKNIKEIPANCFAFNTVPEIIIPDSVEKIGAYAFSNASKIKELDIPDSVTEIGEWAFFSCHDLERVTLSENLTVMEKALFYYCYSLTECEIPNSVVEIKSSVFGDCRSLTEMVIPESVQTIESGIFNGCENLESIYIYSMSQEIPNTLSIDPSDDGGVDLLGARSPKIYCKEGSGAHNKLLEMEEDGYIADYEIIK